MTTLGSTDDDLADAIAGARREVCGDPAAAFAEVQRLLFGARARLLLGRYRVAHRLGTGGQGTVWVARDPELDRDVAIKLIHVSGRDAERAQARLLREARALARISHPNVLAVLDVGVHDGHVFMVTELVRGLDMRRWLDATPRGWLARASVILDAARGLAAVHALGLLHRDVKPTNVFVASDGRALLGDFGLARPWSREPSRDALDRTVADQVATEATAWIGTPAYLAPEQHRGAPGNESTDRYALCVLAWEALFGRRPFEGDSLRELVRAKERGRPIAPRRTGVPMALVRVLRRGLSADPADRLDSTPALLAELERAMRPPRHRAAPIAGTLVAGVLALPTSWTPTPSDDPCADAEAEWARAQPVAADAFVSELAQRVDAYMAEMGPEWSRRTCDAAQRVVASIPEDPQAAAELECLVALRGRLHDAIEIHTHGDASARSGVLRSLAELGRPADCGDAVHRPDPPEEDAAAVAEAREQLANSRAHRRASDVSGALAGVDAAAAIAERVRFEPLFAEVDLARARLTPNDRAVAEPLLTRAHTTAVASHHDEIAIEAALELAHLHAALRDDPEAAQRWMRQAGADVERIRGTRRYALFVGWHAALESKLAAVVGDWDRAALHAEDAIARLETVEGAALWLATATGYAAEAALRRDRATEAEALFRRSVAVHEDALGPSHPQTATAVANLASALVSLHRPADAVPLLRRAIAIREATLGPHALETAPAWQSLAVALRDTGELDAAADAGDRAVEIFREVLGARHQRLAAATWARADVAYAQRDWEGAAERYRDAADQFEALDLPADLAWMLHKRGLALARLGRIEDAIALHERGLEVREASLGSDHVDVVKSLLPLAAARQAAGDRRDALVHATRAETLAAKHDEWRLLALALHRRGRIEHALGRDEAARASLGAAIELFHSNGEPGSVGALALELAILEHDAGEHRAAVVAYERALASTAMPPETLELAVVLALAPDERPNPATIARDLARARVGRSRAITARNR